MKIQIKSHQDTKSQKSSIHFDHYSVNNSANYLKINKIRSPINLQANNISKITSPKLKVIPKTNKINPVLKNKSANLIKLHYLPLEQKIKFIINTTQKIQEASKIYGLFYFTEPMINFDGPIPYIQIHRCISKINSKPLHPISKSNKISQEFQFITHLKSTFKNYFPTVQLGKNKTINGFLAFMNNQHILIKHKKVSSHQTCSKKLNKCASMHTELKLSNIMSQCSEVTHHHITPKQNKRFSVKIETTHKNQQNNRKPKLSMQCPSIEEEDKIDEMQLANTVQTLPKMKRKSVITQSIIQKDLDTLFKSTLNLHNMNYCCKQIESPSQQCLDLCNELNQLF